MNKDSPIRSLPLTLPLVFALNLAGCLTYRPVVVDRKTDLETEILGSFERINTELTPATTSTTDAPLEGPRNELLQAVLERQLLEPHIRELKRDQMVGEGRDGLLATLSTPDPERHPHAKSQIKRENEQRLRQMQAIVALSPKLQPKDLPQVRRVFHQIQSGLAQPGDRVQDAQGNWTTARQ